MKKTILSFAIMMAIFAFKNADQQADNAFMIKATQSNLAEVEAAKLAVAQSTSDSIKAFAQMMIDDHTNAQVELATMANKKSVALPDSTDDAHRMLKQQLMQLKGKSFDSAYLQSQVKDHQQAIALFQSEISGGTDADTKAYATKLLPKLQIHLQHVQSLAQGKSTQMMH